MTFRTYTEAESYLNRCGGRNKGQIYHQNENGYTTYIVMFY